MRKPNVSRREFAKRLVLGAASVSFTHPASAAKAASTNNEPDASQKPEGEQRPLDEVDLVVQTIAERYPDKRLTKTVLDSIGGDVRYNLFLSQQLSRYPLKNSDEPAFVFAAWRSPTSDSNSASSK